MKVMTTVVFFLLCVVVEVHSQTYPFVRHGRDPALSNHSYLDLTRVGASRNWRLECHTDLDTCCISNQGPDRGDWFFPNGSMLQFEESGDGIYQSYPKMSGQQIYIRRRNLAVANGIYQCTIETNAFNNDTGRGIVYVGLPVEVRCISIVYVQYT